jgi:hypothetical protein
MLKVAATDKYTSMELLKSKVKGVAGRSFAQFIWKTMTGAPDSEVGVPDLNEDMSEGLKELVDNFLIALPSGEDELASDVVEAANLTEGQAREILASMAP